MRISLIYILLTAFLANNLGIYPAQASLNLPTPGQMVHISPSYQPPVLRGIKVQADNPFRLEFVVDRGDETSSEAKRESLLAKGDYLKLIKYFLAAVTIPESELWVNLSPYEKDRIIPEAFGKTEMGRDLLAQDYILKQITASLMYPEDEVGKKFWKRVYEESAKKFGHTNIPVNTFNKVWIVPEKAVVYEHMAQPGEAKGESPLAKTGTAYVVESKLKVMLEEDYLSLSHQNSHPERSEGSQNHRSFVTKSVPQDDVRNTTNQIVRQIIIPQLYKEINQGQNFAQLRQVYNSLILATWYKKKLKNSILAQVYADKNKVQGIQYKNAVVPERFSRGPKTVDSRLKHSGMTDPEQIYQNYLQSFKQGAYNYIKEDIDPVTHQATPRKYFSGGFSAQSLFEADSAMIITQAASLIKQMAPNSQIVEMYIKPMDSFIIPMDATINWDWTNALVVNVLESTRDGAEPTEKNYMKNLTQVREEFLNIMYLMNKGTLTRFWFKKRMQRINKILLQGRDKKSDYRTPTTLDGVKISKFAGRFIKSRKFMVEAERFRLMMDEDLDPMLTVDQDLEYLYDNLRIIASLDFNRSNTLDDILSVLADSYIYYIKNLMFKSGNNSLIMNLINGILRLYGLNGISHGNFDYDILRGDSEKSIKDEFIRKVHNANPWADFNQNALAYVKPQDRDLAMASGRLFDIARKKKYWMYGAGIYFDGLFNARNPAEQRASLLNIILDQTPHQKKTNAGFAGSFAATISSAVGLFHGLRNRVYDGLFGIGPYWVVIPKKYQRLSKLWGGIKKDYQLAYLIPDQDLEFFTSEIENALQQKKITKWNAHKAILSLITHSEFIERNGEVEQILSLRKADEVIKQIRDSKSLRRTASIIAHFRNDPIVLDAIIRHSNDTWAIMSALGRLQAKPHSNKSVLEALNGQIINNDPDFMKKYNQLNDDLDDILHDKLGYANGDLNKRELTKILEKSTDKRLDYLTQKFILILNDCLLPQNHDLLLMLEQKILFQFKNLGHPLSVVLPELDDWLAYSIGGYHKDYIERVKLLSQMTNRPWASALVFAANGPHTRFLYTPLDADDIKAQTFLINGFIGDFWVKLEKIGQLQNEEKAAMEKDIRGYAGALINGLLVQSDLSTSGFLNELGKHLLPGKPPVAAVIKNALRMFPKEMPSFLEYADGYFGNEIADDLAYWNSKNNKSVTVRDILTGSYSPDAEQFRREIEKWNEQHFKVKRTRLNEETRMIYGILRKKFLGQENPSTTLQQQAIDPNSRQSKAGYFLEYIGEGLRGLRQSQRNNVRVVMSRLKRDSVFWMENGDHGIYFHEETVKNPKDFDNKFKAGDKILKMHLDGVDREENKIIINEALQTREFKRMKELGYVGIYMNTGNKGFRVIVLRKLKYGIEIETPILTLLKTAITGKYGEIFYGYPKNSRPKRVVLAFADVPELTDSAQLGVEAEQWKGSEVEEKVYELWNAFTQGDTKIIEAILAGLSNRTGMRIFNRVIEDIPRFSVVNGVARYTYKQETQNILDGIENQFQELGFRMSDEFRNTLLIPIENVLQHVVNRDQKAMVLGVLYDDNIYVYVFDSGPGMPVQQVMEHQYFDDEYGNEHKAINYLRKGYLPVAGNEDQYSKASLLKDWMIVSRDELWDQNSSMPQVKSPPYITPQNGTLFALRFQNKSELSALEKKWIIAGNKTREEGQGSIMIRPWGNEQKFHLVLTGQEPSYINLRSYFKDKDVLLIPGYSNNAFIISKAGAKSVTVYDKDPLTIAWLKAIKKYFNYRESKEYLSIGEVLEFMNEAFANFSLIPKEFLDKKDGMDQYLIHLIQQAVLNDGHGEDLQFKGKVEFHIGTAEVALVEQNGRHFDTVYVPNLLGVANGITNVKEVNQFIETVEKIAPESDLLITPSRDWGVPNRPYFKLGSYLTINNLPLLKNRLIAQDKMWGTGAGFSVFKLDDSAQLSVVEQVEVFAKGRSVVPHPEKPGGGKDFEVFIYPEIDLVEKRIRNGGVRRSVLLAQERLGGDDIVADFVSKDGNRLLQESTTSLKVVLDRKLQELRSVPREDDRYNSIYDDIKSLLHNFFEVNQRIIQRGVFNHDPTLENYGVRKDDGKVVLIDIGELTDIYDSDFEDVVSSEDTGMSYMFNRLMLQIQPEIRDLFYELSEQYGFAHGGTVFGQIQKVMSNNKKEDLINPVNGLRLLERLGLKDAAMMNSLQKGGIDLTSDKEFQVKRDSSFRQVGTQNERGIEFRIDKTILQQMQNAPGFEPVIIGIRPAGDLRQFLGINNSK